LTGRRDWAEDVTQQSCLRAIEKAANFQPGTHFTGQVLSTVNALPEAQRACVILAYVEGYSYQETADIIGVPIGTVMSRLSAARAKLAHLKETGT